MINYIFYQLSLLLDDRQDKQPSRKSQAPTKVCSEVIRKTHSLLHTLFLLHDY
jgi:hypothetical protein